MGNEHTARQGFILLIATALLFACFCRVAYCGEGGLGSFLPGVWDSDVGVQPPPGLYFKQFFAHYTGDAVFVMQNGMLEDHIHEDLSLAVSSVYHVTKTRVLDSYYAWALYATLLDLNLQGHIESPPRGLPPQFDERRVSAGPVAISPLTLGWHNGRSHQRVMFLIYTPLGSHDTNRLVNTGRNKWAFELDYGYTFRDPKTLREYSVFPGYTINTSNLSVDYIDGQEFHIEFAAIQRFKNGLGAGLVGYYFIQTTDDSGTETKLGANRGQAVGLGPIVLYNADIGGKDVCFTAKYYSEFAVQNRVEGKMFWFNISMAL